MLPVTPLAGLAIGAGSSPSEGLILSHFLNTREENFASLFFSSPSIARVIII